MKPSGEAGTGSPQTALAHARPNDLDIEDRGRLLFSSHDERGIFQPMSKD
jgi:sugar lactone lactonase YvrE